MAVSEEHGAADSLVDESELHDLDESTSPASIRFDPTVLASPAFVRAVAGIAAATTILLWSGRTDRILARLIGLAAVALFATALWAAIEARPRRLAAIGFAAVGLVASMALVVAPVDSEALLARLVGVALLVVAARDVGRALRGLSDESRTWVLARSVAVAATAAVIIAFPAELFIVATTVIALGWIAVSILVIVAVIDAGADPRCGQPGNEGGDQSRDQSRHLPIYDVSAQRLVSDWLAERPKSVEDRRALYGKILYEGPRTRLRVVRFFTLMGFASVIASMGVITDSTAVVIGAMLIAPLMSPLMGIAISLVMGWPRRLARSALVALGGIVFAVLIGVLLGLSAPTVIDTATNSQILARSSPTMLDLITALAAGAAGAYGLSRPDVSDSLPGVAIAISLVPPLTVVGIAYSQGDWGAGNGALLLFATNMLAIMVMGGVTFVATGVTPIHRIAENQFRVRTALAAVATLAALVVGSLLINGAQITADLFEQSAVDDAVAGWLGDAGDHSLVRTDVDGETITVVIVGPSDGAPTASSLADHLADALERPVTAQLRLIVEERSVASRG